MVTRGGGGWGGGGKLQRSRAPTHAGGWMVSVGGTRGLGGTEGWGGCTRTSPRGQQQACAQAAQQARAQAVQQARAAAVEGISFIELLFNTTLLYYMHIKHSKQQASIKSSSIAKPTVPSRIIIETALVNAT